MPWVDLVSDDDYASIWYITNSPFGNVGSFDPEKPSIIILHPMFLDSSWLNMQFGDPRLDAGYNIIAFDMRMCGKSASRPSGFHDSWVEAADLAFAHQMLHLPPCHIFALESISTNCAIRFAALFPELCLSLTLCNVPPPTELRWVFTAYDELLQSWCFAEDLDSFEHVGMKAARFVLGQDLDPDLQDDLIEYWELTIPPASRERLLEQISVLMNRSPLKPQVLASIRKPVLIVQSERCETCPMKYAERLQAELVNAEGGAILYTVKGASGYLNIIPSHASIANQVFAKFLTRLPRARSDIRPPPIPIAVRMKAALARLGELTDDPSVGERNPGSSASFSRLLVEVTRSQFDSLRVYAKDKHRAFRPVGNDGRPMRRFSSRREEHWFQGGQDGISYAGSDLASAKQMKRQKSDSSHGGADSPSEPCVNGGSYEGRVKRTTLNGNSVEKLTMKGTISKVVEVSSNPLTGSLQRLHI